MRSPATCRGSSLDRAILPVRNANGEEVDPRRDRGSRCSTASRASGSTWPTGPGSLKEMLKQMASGNPDETYEPEPMRPEYLERAARLRLLERQGVETLRAVPAGHGARRPSTTCDDTEALYANMRSFNRWYDETWGFDPTSASTRDGPAVAPRPRPRR